MKIKDINKAALGFFSFGCLGLIFIIGWDKFYWHVRPLREGNPDFSIAYLVRSFIILLCTLSIIWGFINKKAKFVLIENKLNLEGLCILGVFAISIMILVLFILTPDVFNNIAIEDGAVEWLSALLLFCSSAIMLGNFFKSYHSNVSVLIKISFALLSFVFFIIAMEEISWFQRVLNIKTPDTFGANYQNEMNLHNFATGIVENAYYFCTALYLVVFPFIRLSVPIISDYTYLRIFVARPFIAVIGSIAYAYNFDMWNIVLTQVAFFGSIIILIIFALLSDNRNTRDIVLFAIFINIVTQIIFMVNYKDFAFLWVVTEYKELLIPLIFLFYCFDTANTLNTVLEKQKI